MDEELDLVVFEDDAGNELTMEVLDYLEDQEEFVPIDDSLAETLMKIFESEDFDEVFDDEDEEE